MLLIVKKPSTNQFIYNLVFLGFMSYQLIITEKPTSSQKIAQALADKKPEVIKEGKVSYYHLTHNGKEIYVVCAVGHLFTVTEAVKAGWKYPVFDIKWAASSEANKESGYTKPYLNVIKKLAKGANSFVVACDWDIEGEVIGERILHFVCKKNDALRMHYSTTTQEDLRESYEKIAPHIDRGLAEAGITRHELDYIYGINLSRALTLSIKNATGMFKILSSGRVQGPALKTLYDKEKEIEAFKPEPYWEIELKGDAKGKNILAYHKEDRFFDKKIAEKAYKNALGKKAIVSGIDKKEVKQSPPLPFDLTTLQIESYAVLGLTPKITLEIAQNLYTNSYISYPRTSSQQLPATINYKKILKKLNGSPKFAKETEYLLGKAALKPNEGKKTDPAHPAIYPTGELPKKLQDREAALYDLIVHRFFSVFGEEALRETVTIEIDVNKELFIAKGTRTISQGWHSLYGRFLHMEEEELPNVKAGDAVDVKELNLLDKQTQPPKRYTEASIIRELEKRNLGTKATRAGIIDNLYQRNYIHEKAIQVTDLGKKTVDTLIKYSPEILDEALTRKFEEEMDLIHEGKKKGDEVIEEAEEILLKTLNKFKKNEKAIGEALGKANLETQQKESYLGICPVCGEGTLNIRRGKFGIFAACSHYPDCKTAFSLPKFGKIKATEKLCPVCGYPIIQVLRAGKGMQEVCINPGCPCKKIPDAIACQVKYCPKCKSQLVLRKSVYGAFWACPGYPKCRYIEKIKEIENKVQQKGDVKIETKVEKPVKVKKAVKKK